MNRFVVFVICSVAVVQLGVAAPVSSGDISPKRAWKLAAMYYSRYVSGCGGVGEVVTDGSHWLAPVHFGVAGTFSGYIRVDRRTGSVAYSGHPTVSAESLDAWFASVTQRPKHSNQAMQRTAR